MTNLTRASGVPTLPWATFTTQQDVAHALRFYLKRGTPLGQVQEFAQVQGMDVSPLHGNVVYASVPASRSGYALEAEWLVRFRFDADLRLQGFRVREGVLGP